MYVRYLEEASRASGSGHAAEPARSAALTRRRFLGRTRRARA
jgi:hypothetical protein